MIIFKKSVHQEECSYAIIDIEKYYYPINTRKGHIKLSSDFFEKIKVLDDKSKLLFITILTMATDPDIEKKSDDFGSCCMFSGSFPLTSTADIRFHGNIGFIKYYGDLSFKINLKSLVKMGFLKAYY